MSASRNCNKRFLDRSIAPLATPRQSDALVIFLVLLLLVAVGECHGCNQLQSEQATCC